MLLKEREARPVCPRKVWIQDFPLQSFNVESLEPV